MSFKANCIAIVHWNSQRGHKPKAALKRPQGVQFHFK